MLDFVKRAYQTLTYDARTDPAKIPAKLHLEGIGELDYICNVKGENGQFERIFADDPTRTFCFVKTGKPSPRTSEDVMPRIAVVALGLCLVAQGAALGACVALGIWPGIVALTFTILITLWAIAPHRQEVDIDSEAAMEKKRHELAMRQQMASINPRPMRYAAQEA